MTAPSPNEIYDKILTANLQRAIDFLKYAEAKNGALLALASAWIVAIINLLSGNKVIPGWINISIRVTLILSLLAGILAMLSFMPKLKLIAFLGGKRAGPHPKNLLYYGDIASLPIKTLTAELHNRYMPKAQGVRAEYLQDLVVQLSVNSEITLRKMMFFRWGMALILIAGILLLIPAIVMVGRTLLAW